MLFDILVYSHTMQPRDPQTVQELQTLLSAERHASAQLQRELNLRNGALDSTATHFMIIDVCRSRWKITYANRAIAQAHGYECAEIIGRNPALLVSLPDNGAALERIAEAVRTGNTIRIELVARRKNETKFWAGLFMTPIRGAEGNVSHYIASGADITARLEQERAQRQLQEQLYSEMQERERIAIELRLAQKLESVGRLAAGIAHEINTPIQYIADSVSFLQSSQADLQRLQGAYQSALNEFPDNEHRRATLAALRKLEDDLDIAFLSKEMPKAFQRTLEGVERVAAIVRAMKEFAHPDSAEQSSADLNHAIETTLTVAHNEYKYCAQVETLLNELPFVTCNVGEMNQVFLNLIVNAAHAIVESGKDIDTGRITISTMRSGEYAVISIADNGCGIPEENLEKIFDPFYTTKPVGRGTGQGLAIARSIVIEKHGGAIDVQSTVGSGTCFIIQLPIGGHAAVKAT